MVDTKLLYKRVHGKRRHMEKIPNGKYTKEFREEAVKLVTLKGYSVDDAA